MNSDVQTPSPDWKRLSPRELREEMRAGTFSGLTSGLAPGYLQGNLIVVPQAVADEFEEFCGANPQSLPILERGSPGDPMLGCGGEFDVRTDLPKYRIWRDGHPAEVVRDMYDSWSCDSTAFVLGCWFANEDALARAGIRMRHIELGIQGSLFRTNIPSRSVGRFSSHVVASMRPFAKGDVKRVAEISRALPKAHGAPIHIGNPGCIGIGNLGVPDFGEPIPPLQGETPMFWACGLTGQDAVAASGIPLFVTHEPGHMAVTDIPVEPET